MNLARVEKGGHLVEELVVCRPQAFLPIESIDRYTHWTASIWLGSLDRYQLSKKWNRKGLAKSINIISTPLPTKRRCPNLSNVITIHTKYHTEKSHVADYISTFFLSTVRPNLMGQKGLKWSKDDNNIPQSIIGYYRKPAGEWHTFFIVYFLPLSKKIWPSPMEHHLHLTRVCCT